MDQVIIDVREKDEFDSEFIANSLHFPLSSIGKNMHHLLTASKGRVVLLICQSGRRAIIAKNEIERHFQSKVSLEIFEGGLNEWKAQGRTVVTVGAKRLPIMRQVQIVAGGIVFVSSVLAITVNFHFAYLAGFVGAGLTFAGVSGTCFLANLLYQLPYNKNLNSSAKSCTK
jgi:rhodanese-related sulfurtransferase